ncbi:MAG: NAAT family transporter [Phycisphaerae bacterium]|nr:NAAT family transporter [Phycisphaerae bacterium]
MTTVFFQTFLMIFFLLTPFAAVSAFLSLTAGHDSSREKLRVALHCTLAMLVLVAVIFFFGKYIFDLFGITLDAFRVGGGTLLLLASINLARGTKSYQVSEDEKDIAVVPLAIPLIVGPGTIGALFVLGAEISQMRQRLVALAGALLAAAAVGGLLVLTVFVERRIKPKFIVMLSKITGLILAGLAAQLIFQGIRGLMQ